MKDRFELQGNLLVLDHETGLIWQRGASKDRMVWGDGHAYIEKLNKDQCNYKVKLRNWQLKNGLGQISL